MKTFYFTISLILSVITTQAQNIQWLDTLKYSWFNYGTAVSTDSSGNVYIAGGFSPPNRDTVYPCGIFISKNDSLGNLIWMDKKDTKTLSSGGIVTGKTGNTYAAFLAWNTVSFGTYTFSTSNSALGFSMILVKYNTSGTVIWAKMVDNAGPSGLLLDEDENLYVYGTTNGTAIFDSYTVGESKNFVAKYNTSGTCDFLLSTAQGINNASVDGLGNIYVTDWNGPSGPFLLKKYNSTGVLQWTTYSYSGIVQADRYGNCYLWGYFGGAVTFGKTTLTNPYTNGAVQSFLAKIDANGNYVWAVAPQSPYYFRGIYVTEEAVYVTGNTGNDDPNGWIRHGFISKYDTSGSLVNDNIYIQNNNSYNVTVSKTGGIYLTGGSWSYGGCIAAFLAKVSNYGSFVGLKENSTSVSKITIYPNPTGGIITIQSSEEIKNAEIKIENLIGQLIYSKKINTNSFGIDETIDLSHSPKGVYFVQVNTGAALEVRKVVLE